MCAEMAVNVHKNRDRNDGNRETEKQRNRKRNETTHLRKCDSFWDQHI